VGEEELKRVIGGEGEPEAGGDGVEVACLGLGFSIDLTGTPMLLDGDSDLE
jgi:hypothetical protein